MHNWDQIMTDASQLAVLLRQQAIDLAEAEKTGDYFVSHDCSEAGMVRYLDLLASNPPMRSKRSQRHYRGLRTIWHDWQTSLEGKDKARAWGWGVRIAKAQR